MTRSIDWAPVTESHVLTAIGEYDALGSADFFAAHGFAPATTYELLVAERVYPPKAILGRAYEVATGERLASPDFEGGRAGAVTVLTRLGFTVRPQQP